MSAKKDPLVNIDGFLAVNDHALYEDAANLAVIYEGLHTYCGIVSAGRNKETGEENMPKLELVRLTISRRVYTQAHMDMVAESVESVYAERAAIRGLTMIYEPKYLRFFQARFEPLA